MSDYTEAETLHAEIDRLVGCRPGCGWNCRWRSLRVLKPKQSRRLSAGGDHAMTSNSTNSAALQSQAETAIHLLDDWFDPIEVGLRDRGRGFIEAMIEAELEAALSRPRYARRPKGACEMPMARAVSLATGMATDHGRCWGPLAGWRSPCRGPGLPHGGQDKRVEERGAAGLPAANQAGRFADRRRLSCRHQYATGAAGAVSGLRRGGG